MPSIATLHVDHAHGDQGTTRRGSSSASCIENIFVPGQLHDRNLSLGTHGCWRNAPGGQWFACLYAENENFSLRNWKWSTVNPICRWAVFFFLAPFSATVSGSDCFAGQSPGTRGTRRAKVQGPCGCLRRRGKSTGRGWVCRGFRQDLAPVGMIGFNVAKIWCGFAEEGGCEAVPANLPARRRGWPSRVNGETSVVSTASGAPFLKGTPLAMTSMRGTRDKL